MASSILEKGDFSCALDIPSELPSRPLPYELRHDLVLAVKEALHNAIKHSGGGRVRLALRLDDHSLSLVVQDDGQWREARPGAAQGNGLPNLTARLARHHGSVRLRPSAEGTAVTLVVPLPPITPLP